MRWHRKQTDLRADAGSVDDLFVLLEHLLADTAIRRDPAAKPVLFELLPERQQWRFEPRVTGPLFSRVSEGNGPARDSQTLRLVCKADLLLRLLSAEPLTLGPDDIAGFEGDIDDLLPLADALDQSQTLLALRANR